MHCFVRKIIEKYNILWRILKKKKNMMKIEDIILFHTFQAILHIVYLKYLTLWKGVGPGMHNFKWYKIIRNLEKKVHICSALWWAYFRAHHFAIFFINKSPSLWDPFKTMLTFICYLVLKLFKIKNSTLLLEHSI